MFRCGKGIGGNCVLTKGGYRGKLDPITEIVTFTEDTIELPHSNSRIVGPQIV